MTTPKAILYLQQLDSARCSSEWDKVPECARKVAKHAPGRKCCLTLVSTSEAKLHLEYLPLPPRSSEKYISFLSTATALEAALQEELTRIKDPPRLPTPASGASGFVTNEDVFQAKVTLAWIRFLKGEYQAVVDGLPEESDTPKLAPGEGEMEYTRVVLLKSVVLKGLALERISENDQSVALSTYKMATHLPYSSALGAYNEGIQWAEKALGRFAVVAYKCWEAEEARQRGEGAAGKAEQRAVNSLVDDATVIFAFRSFNTFMKNVRHQKDVSMERIRERREVYHCYLLFLSTLLRESTKNYSNQFAYQLRQHQPSPHRLNETTISDGASARGSTIGVVGGSGKTLELSREELKDELKIIESIYGEMLFNHIKFPAADEVHEEVLEYVDLLMANWRNMGSLGEEAKGVVEDLYRASTKTFHSPRVMRHLFVALTAAGNFHDAGLALDTYIEFIEKGKERIERGGKEMDFDDENTILLALPEGIKLLAKYLNDGRKALEVTEHLEKWLVKWNIVAEGDPKLSSEQQPEIPYKVVSEEALSAAYRGIGIGHAAWSRATIESSERADSQQKSLSAFQNCLDIDPYDSEALFDQAVVLAETRAIPEAIEAVKYALQHLQSPGDESPDEPIEATHARSEFRRRAVPMWHLLALLLSAQGDYENATRACEAAFELFGGESHILDIKRAGSESNFEKFGRSSSVVDGMTIGEKERLLELKSTQIALVEAQESPDVAVNLADELLALYRKLFEGIQINTEEETKKNLVVVDPVKSRPGSRYSVFSRRDKKRDSVTSFVRPKSAAGSQTSKTAAAAAATAPAQTDSSGAPKIHITDPNGASPEPSDSSKLRRKSRANSLRKKKSVASVKNSSEKIRSHVSTDTEPEPQPKQGHSPRRSLDKIIHHLSHSSISRKSTESTTGIAVTTDDPASMGHNFPPSRLPHPARGLDPEAAKIEAARSLSRPPGLSEPCFSAEDEKRRVSECLMRIWLLIAGLYRRSGLLEDAAAAVEEAATLIRDDGEREADVCAERGLLFVAQSRPQDALSQFNHALTLVPDHALSITALSNLTLKIPIPPFLAASEFPTTNFTLPRIHSLLSTLTRLHAGHDNPDAWFALGKCFEDMGEAGRARECYWWCVSLEDTKPVRNWARIGVRVL